MPIVTSSGAPSIVFGDIVSALLVFLRLELPSVECGAVVPEVLPAAGFVRLQRTGGARLTRVSESAQVSIDVWADTLPIAHDLAQSVRGVLAVAPGAVPGVYRVDEVSGPGLLVDPVRPELPRFVWTIAAHVRGT